MKQNKRVSWSTVSKTVGWDDRDLDYPTMAYVERLYEEAQKPGEQPLNRYALLWLLNYHRFLKSPVNEQEREILKRITQCLFDCKERFCD